MFEFINKCFENDVSVEFERNNYLLYRPVRVILTKNNYHLARVFSYPEISCLINDEDLFKNVLLGCLDELLNYDPDTTKSQRKYETEFLKVKGETND